MIPHLLKELRASVLSPTHNFKDQRSRTTHDLLAPMRPRMVATGGVRRRRTEPISISCAISPYCQNPERKRRAVYEADRHAHVPHETRIMLAIQASRMLGAQRETSTCRVDCSEMIITGNCWYAPGSSPPPGSPVVEPGDSRKDKPTPCGSLRRVDPRSAEPEPGEPDPHTRCTRPPGPGTTATGFYSPPQDTSLPCKSGGISQPAAGILSAPPTTHTSAGVGVFTLP